MDLLGRWIRTSPWNIYMRTDGGISQDTLGAQTQDGRLLDTIDIAPQNAIFVISWSM